MKCVMFFRTIKFLTQQNCFKNNIILIGVLLKKLENIQYVCNFNAKHADFEMLSISREVVIFLISDTVVNSATIINKFVRLDSSVDMINSLLLSSNFCLYF